MTIQQKLNRLVKLLKDIAVNMEEAAGLFGDLMEGGYDQNRVLDLAVKAGANRDITRRLLMVLFAVNAGKLHPQLVKHLESRPSLLPRAMSLDVKEQAKLLKMTVDQVAARLRPVRTPRRQSTDTPCRVVRCAEGIKIIASGTDMVLSESMAVHLAETILGMVKPAKRKAS